MDLKELQKNWDEFGKTDPMWATLTWPDKKKNKWQIDEFFKTGTQEIEAIMKYVGSLNMNIPHRKALDFGCGIGRLTQALADYFDDVYGIDIAPSMIRFANKYNRCKKKCHYLLNESNDLKLFENNTFDFIYSNIVLQHMRPEYSRNYIKEFVRILAPGGIAIFQIPSKTKLTLDKSAIQKLPDSGFKAQIILINPPSTIEVGSQAALLVKVKNIGDICWPALGTDDGKYQIKLGNHWLGEKENIVINDDARAILPRNLEPGDEIELVLFITAPQEPGTYILELDLVQEKISWFSNKGSKTIRVPVKVIYSDILNKFQPIIYPGRVVPITEMHSVQKDEIIDLIKSAGGKLIDIQEDYFIQELLISQAFKNYLDISGHLLYPSREWLSFRYCVSK